MRIVSLLPSATEIVCSLGLEDQLVGVTHECDFPPFVKDLPKVTRTLIPRDATSREIDGLVRERLASSQTSLYSLEMSTLERLRPDLLVTQTLCDVCAVATEEVTAAACVLPGRPRVLNLEPTRLSEVLDSIRLVGEAIGVAQRADDVIASLQARIQRVSRSSESIKRRPRVILLEWLDPPFSSGHWTPELVRIAGGNEGLGRDGEKSRSVTWDEIRRFDPEFLLIACCGYPVERTLQDIPILVRSPGFNDLHCTRSGNILIVDGNAYFNRPGPRLVDGLEIIAHAIHREIHPLTLSLIPAYRLAFNL